MDCTKCGGRFCRSLEDCKAVKPDRTWIQSSTEITSFISAVQRSVVTVGDLKSKPVTEVRDFLGPFFFMHRELHATGRRSFLGREVLEKGRPE